MPNNENKIAIIVAPNGARKTQKDHPALPMSKDEIISEVIACRDAGAAMVHLHARTKSGQHSLEIDDNLQILDALKTAVGESIMIQLTTEAVGMYLPKQQIELIKETMPEAASFALSELIPDDSYAPEAEKFFRWVSESGIIAQYILYSANDLKRYCKLIKEGVLPNRNHHILLVLGRYQKDQLSIPSDLIPFLSEPCMHELMSTNKVRWATCAFGVNEQKCLTSAMLMGGDIRVGFENNHFDNRGLQAKNNAQQVNEIIKLSNFLNINLHSADSLRKELKR